MAHVPACAYILKCVSIDSYPEVKARNSTTHREPLCKVNYP